MILAVVLLHRKRTMERADPISKTWRMFAFLASATITAIPNRTLTASQGTATANRMVMWKRSPTNDARIPRVARRMPCVFNRSKKA